VPMSLPIEERCEGPGELPGVDVKPGVGGLRYSREHYCVLSLKPDQRLPIIREVFRYHPKLRGGQGESIAGWMQKQGRAVRGVQVVVQYPVHGRASLGVTIHGVGVVDSVGAQQVMEGEPAWGMLGDHPRVGQLIHRLTRLPVGEAN